jgi:hypothetical protein
MFQSQEARPGVHGGSEADERSACIDCFLPLSLFFFAFLAQNRPQVSKQPKHLQINNIREHKHT